MERQDLDVYRIRLLNERDSILRTIDAVRQVNSGISQRETSSELSMVDNHPGDLGTEMFDKERDLALIGNEKHLLEEVQQSLQRIETGTYGRCSFCGGDIEKERLDFLPYAQDCSICSQKKQDYRTFRYDRPVEEERMRAFGKYFMDSPEAQQKEVGYNAEDTWQEVEMINEYQGHKRTYEKSDGSSTQYGQDDGEEDGQEDDDNGYVELTDAISNQYYKEQLP